MCRSASRRLAKPASATRRLASTSSIPITVSVCIRFRCPAAWGEGAGIVEAVGHDVTHVQVGDRVAYAGGPPGSYCEMRVMPADRLVKIPEGISARQAAAMMLKGMTVQYLIPRTSNVQPGATVLCHAAAGGAGL